MILLLCAIWGLLIFFFWFSRPAVVGSELLRDLPNLQGHRGYTQKGAIENSLESLIASRQFGLQMCEFDVRLTADQIPILFHDQDTKRIFGVDAEVNKLNLAELKKLGAITTLREILQSPLVPSRLNIEIKSSKVLNSALIKAVMDDIDRFGADKVILISSFNPFVLRQVATYKSKSVLRALLVTEQDEPGNRHFLKKMWLMRWSRCHMLNLDQKMIHKGRMMYFKSLDIPIAAWTVNDLKRAQELLSLGVVSLITDRLRPDDFIEMV